MPINFQFIPSSSLPSLSYGITESPWGRLFVVFHGEDMYGLGFENPLSEEAPHPYFEKRFKTSLSAPDHQQAQRFVTALENDNPFSCIAMGTPFQHAVWRALLQIPKGETRSYHDIATTIGNPKAVRAVGTAIGRNPIALFIPCHRVISKSGAWGGFLWGLPMKQELLKSEVGNH